MSARSMLEFDHDKKPQSFEECIRWSDKLLAYLRTGDSNKLPDGVTYFGLRDSSEPAPMVRPDSFSVRANQDITTKQQGAAR